MSGQGSDAPFSAWTEAVKIVPSLLWLILAACAFAILYSPVMKLIDAGQIKEVQLGVLHVTLAERDAENVSRDAIGGLAPDEAFKPVISRFKNVAPKIVGTSLLWVDDKHPEQNLQERRLLSAFGIRIDMARTTDEGLNLLRKEKYDVVISNMRRDGDPKAPCYSSPEPSEAGCDFLRKVAMLPNAPAVIIYAANYRPDWGTPAYASAMTNRTDYLAQYVFDALERRAEP